MTVQEALVDRLKRAMPELRTHSVVAVWIFGSVARDEARDESDVDILVDFSPPREPVSAVPAASPTRGDCWTEGRPGLP
jgi:predicted nucleotidyltransferase